MACQLVTNSVRGGPIRPKSSAIWACANVDTSQSTGVALVTAVIAAAHLYPRLPSIMLTYLLLIIALASTQRRYAALLAAVLASFSFNCFLTSPPDQFSFPDDLLDPWVFLAVAIIAGQLTVALRHYAQQARHSEQETRLLSQRAQALAAFQEASAWHASCTTRSPRPSMVSAWGLTPPGKPSRVIQQRRWPRWSA
jgi:K+-sensing histidine kinase KdpD